jgi:hypothetical protein
MGTCSDDDTRCERIVSDLSEFRKGIVSCLESRRHTPLACALRVSAGMVPARSAR